MIGTVIISLLVFGFLIFIHEFGHYITARIFNVSIKEFCIGMGPKLVWYESKKTGITYGVAMFPIGGYVAMVGEDEDSDDPNAFNKKPAWQRLIITAAGATVNIVAGFLAMIILVLFSDIGGTVYAMPVSNEDLATVEGLDITYRSENYGFENGDLIVSVNGKKVVLDAELDYEISRFGHEPVDIVVNRNGELITLEDVRFPVMEQQGQIFGMRDFKVYKTEKNFFNVFSISFRKAALVMRMCWESIFDLIIKNKELIEVKKRGHGNPLTSKEEKIARAFIGEHWEGIVDKWISLFVMNARVRCTNIKTKIQTDEK